MLRMRRRCYISVLHGSASPYSQICLGLPLFFVFPFDIQPGLAGTSFGKCFVFFCFVNIVSAQTLIVLYNSNVLLSIYLKGGWPSSPTHLKADAYRSNIGEFSLSVIKNTHTLHAIPSEFLE